MNKVYAVKKKDEDKWAGKRTRDYGSRNFADNLSQAEFYSTKNGPVQIMIKRRNGASNKFDSDSWEIKEYLVVENSPQAVWELAKEMGLIKTEREEE